MKKAQVVLLHIVFWFYKFGFYETFGQFFHPDKKFDWSEYLSPLGLSHLIIFPVIFYLNYLVIMPRFFKTKQYKKALLGFIALLLLFVLIRYLVQELLFLKWFGSTNYADGTTIAYYIFDNTYFGGSIIVMSILLWLINDIIIKEKEKTILIREKRHAEISFLRSQINPHFIFNTMNNIYSLVYHKSDKALPAIEKLSGIMRYVMKDSDAEKIELTKEVTYLNNFIELQSLRSKDEAVVQFTVEGSTDGKMIAPLLLIPFVENGFKHGVTNDVAHPLIMKLFVAANTLKFVCINKISDGKKDESSGIGLQNVRRRLDLLYPGNYTLNVDQTTEQYSTQLTINL
ncbi:MAG: histidine kinase [Chitinophagaceae bacterium]